jgi:hypothetical protein
MILEEIQGDVKVTIIKENGKTVAVAINDYISDHESSTICVIGEGKAVIRVDPNCTFEIRGKTEEISTEESTPVAAPAAIPEAAPVAEVVPTPVEAPSTAAEETPAKK